MKLIALPMGRIGANIFTDFHQFGIVSDDVIEIVTLPDGICI